MTLRDKYVVEVTASTASIFLQPGEAHMHTLPAACMQLDVIEVTHISLAYHATSQGCVHC